MVIFGHETKTGKEGFTIIRSFAIRLRVMKSPRLSGTSPTLPSWAQHGFHGVSPQNAKKTLNE